MSWLLGGWYSGHGVAHWFARIGAKSAVSLCGHLALVRALNGSNAPHCKSCERLVGEKRH